MSASYGCKHIKGKEVLDKASKWAANFWKSVGRVLDVHSIRGDVLGESYPTAHAAALAAAARVVHALSLRQQTSSVDDGAQ